MIYYQQIVQNYYKDKVHSYRMEEQEQAEAPQAGTTDTPEDKAKKLILQADSTPGQEIPVIDGWVLRRSTTKNSMNLRQGKTLIMVKDSGGKEIPEGKQALIDLLSGGKAPTKSSFGKESLNKQPTEDTSRPQKPQTIIAGNKEYIINEKFMLFPGNLLEPNEFQKIFTELKIDESEIFRFLNGQGKEGSIARIILQARDSVEKSEDDDTLMPFEQSDNLTKLKQDAANKLYEIFDMLKKHNGTLDIDSAKYIKNSIAISKDGEILIKTQLTGEGLIIKEGASTYLSKVLEHLASKTVDPETSQKLNLRKNAISFTKQFKTTGTAAFNRGFYFEDVRRGVIHQIKYNKAEKIGNRELMAFHGNNASESFSRWVGKRASVVSKDFETMIDYFKDNGSIAYNVEDGQAGLLMRFISQHLTNNPDSTPNNAVKVLSGLLIKFGAAGVTLRRPDDVAKTGDKTGSGLKADATEVYNTRDNAINALNKIGIKDPRIIERMIRAYENHPVTIGDSIKFCSSKDEPIKLGQASLEYIQKLFNIRKGMEESSEAIQQYTFLQSIGFQDEDFDNLETEFTTFNTQLRALQTVRSYETIGKDGKQIKVSGREAILHHALELISKNDTINDESTEELAVELRSLITRTVGSRDRITNKWEEVSNAIAKALQRKRIMTTFKSDPRKAIGVVGMLTMCGGGAADGCILSVADTVSGKMYSTEQTSTLNKVIESLSNPEATQLKATGSGFVINEISVDFDGKTAFVYLPKQRLLETIQKEGIGSIQQVRGSELDLSSIQIVIKNQMRLLEQIYKIIAKDGHN